MKTSVQITVVVLLLSINFRAYHVDGASYRVIDIGDHPRYGASSTTNAEAINSVGQIVGGGRVTESSDSYRAFLYDKGKMIDVGMLPGYTYSARAIAINDLGAVVGFSNAYPSLSGPVRAFKYEKGILEDIGTLGGANGEAHGINNHGHIVGTSSIPNSVFSHAFLYVDGTMFDLGASSELGSVATAINNNGQIVGYRQTADGWVLAVIFDQGGMIDLGTFGGNLSVASDINDSGVIVGLASLPGDRSQHAFVFRDGEKMDLGTFGGNYSGANAINNHGQVVGFSQISGNQARAFVYDIFTAKTTNLNDMIDPNLGFTLFGANSINDSGQIVGYGTYATKTNLRSVLLIPIPEPSTSLLIIPACIFYIAVRREFDRT